MRLVRLVVVGLALGAAIGFVGALVRPRRVRSAALAGTVGGTALEGGATGVACLAPTVVLPLGAPALSGSAGTC
jgi:pimeloyl-ACP methyl ester carboxylesterase